MILEALHLRPNFVSRACRKKLRRIWIHFRIEILYEQMRREFFVWLMKGTLYSSQFSSTGLFDQLGPQMRTFNNYVTLNFPQRMFPKTYEGTTEQTKNKNI